MLEATLRCGYGSPRAQAALQPSGQPELRAVLHDLLREHMGALFSLAFSKRQYQGLSCGSPSRWEEGVPSQGEEGTVLPESLSVPHYGAQRVQGGSEEADVVSAALPPSPHAPLSFLHSPTNQ